MDGVEAADESLLSDGAISRIIKAAIRNRNALFMMDSVINTTNLTKCANFVISDHKK